MPNGVLKLSINLGKKTAANPDGLCALSVTKDPSFRLSLLTSIQDSLDDIVGKRLNVETKRCTRREHEGVMGMAVGMNGGNVRGAKRKKKKPKKDASGKVIPSPPYDISDDVFYVSSVPSLSYAVLPSAPCGDTGGAGRIVVDFGERDSQVIVGRDISVVVKVRCEVEGGVEGEVVDGVMEEGWETEVKGEVGEFGKGLIVDKSVEEVERNVEAMNVGEEGEKKDENMVVNPWDVSGKIDYDKLVEHFGSIRIDGPLLKRLEDTIKKIGKVNELHPWIRRGIFFSHRDLTRILDMVDAGKPFYLYTGRGPSSAAMHLGHLVPFMMTAWLQKAFDVPLVVQMTDDEKYIWKGEYKDGDDNLDYFRGLTRENAKDIISCGFDKSKTFIFSDCDYVGSMYPNIVRIWKAVTYATAQAMFGFNKHNIGQPAFPAIQAAPAFPSSFPVVLGAGRGSEMACLIPCAIDQDPYFRMTRDVAHKLTPKSHPLGGKPALFHSKFFPPLQGASGKMSSSDTNSAIFLTDSPEEIKSKIMKHAFSGGHETAKEQKEKGADLDVDVSYQWLRFFLDDDEKLEKIGKDYSSGSGDYWATGMVKKELISILQDIVAKHQDKRKDVTEEVVDEWMAVRKLDF